MKHLLMLVMVKAQWPLILVAIVAMNASQSLCAASITKPQSKSQQIPLVGEIASDVSLSLITSQGTKPWHSHEWLGRQALVYFLVPAHASMRKLPSVPLSDNPADVKYFIVPQWRPETKDGNSHFEQPWQVLKDKQQILCSKYAPGISKPTAVVIDKAGFLRMVQPVMSSADWEKVMEKVKLISLRSSTSPIQVGEIAPDFIIKDMNGITRSLHQLHGKRHLLLTFFPKCFTFTCGMQLSSLRDSWPKLQAKHLEVWGVSVDRASGSRGQKAFADYLHLQFPLLPDSGHQLCLLYGSVLSTNQMSSRMSVLIDKNGIVRWIDKQIDPRHYGEDVLAKMEELHLN